MQRADSAWVLCAGTLSHSPPSHPGVPPFSFFYCVKIHVTWGTCWPSW
ncbi:unnamed protein product [Nyctereutes procyonoides]|uniref:(raccoon dog) hypothetical protein n=1 Tax=Nyctereutes procyonoides TaxID=34880 RepID=A0A811XXC4_NYCPR|nr:unnamed protein product [Nyctereutes procyonoides]